MGIRSGMKRYFSGLVAVKKWADVDRTKRTTRGLIDSFKNLFIARESTRTESLQDAMQRLNLSEADLRAQRQNFLRLALIMTTVAVGIFIYALYRFIQLNFLTGFISLIIMMLALTLAFRYHFWYFQLKKGKLGCTFSEWFYEGLLGKKL